LDHGSRTNKSESSTFNNLATVFAHELHYFEVGHLPIRGVRKHEIASPGQWNSKDRIHVDPHGSWLKEK
jgi:hypothetical protein